MPERPQNLDGPDHHVFGDYDFKPARSSGVRCSVCRRPFAAGTVPESEFRRGYLVKVCRDCRADEEESQLF